MKLICVLIKHFQHLVHKTKNFEPKPSGPLDSEWRTLLQPIVVDSEAVSAAATAVAGAVIAAAGAEDAAAETAAGAVDAGAARRRRNGSR